MATSRWLEVDRKGLAQTLEGRSKGFVALEAIQNALDEPGVTTISLTIARLAGTPYAGMMVEDNAPDGWSDLSHAYTMFAPSKKKADPTLRGRWNVGEKWILALARAAEIRSTKGGVRFDAKGRHAIRERRDAGSTLYVEVRMTDDEMEEAVVAARSVLVPKGVVLSVNGVKVSYIRPLREVETTLPTVLSGEDGVLRPTTRKTLVRIHRPAVGYAWIHEMGIPVVPVECEWSIDVAQRVPLTLDRDNVPPSYLRKVLAVVANEMASEIRDAGAPWVSEAIGSPEIEAEAMQAVLDQRYGTRRVMFDPSDVEANKRAAAEGYHVVAGRSLGGDAAANIRRFRAEGVDLLQPAGQVTPSVAGVVAARMADNPDAPAMQPIPYGRLKQNQRIAVDVAGRLASALLGRPVCIVVYPDYVMNVPMAATWEESQMALYVPGMRNVWDNRSRLVALIIHEVAHHYSSDHLSEQYYEALSDLGAKAVELALSDPTLFDMVEKT